MGGAGQGRRGGEGRGEDGREWEGGTGETIRRKLNLGAASRQRRSKRD
jgi:hypothetical protein